MSGACAAARPVPAPPRRRPRDRRAGGLSGDIEKCASIGRCRGSGGSSPAASRSRSCARLFLALRRGRQYVGRSYPNRLAEELTHRFPGNEITVLNRGVNGDEIAGMLARLDRAVIAEKPDLVLLAARHTNSLYATERCRRTPRSCARAVAAQGGPAPTSC